MKCCDVHCKKGGTGNWKKGGMRIGNWERGTHVLDGALAGDDGLHEEAEHGEHGEAAVLDLLDLQLGEGVWVVSKAQGVEGLTRVKGVEACTKRVTEYICDTCSKEHSTVAEHDSDRCTDAR